jgi:6-phosphogluconolactonase
MAASVHVEVLGDRAALVERARALVVEQIKMAIAERGQCYIALAGGSTPKPLYEALAKETLPWPNLHIFWGDERYVPIDHPDSNAGMAKAAWLDQVAIPSEHIYPVPTADTTPSAAADQYQTTLETVMGSAPIFDVVLLGMGDDGHTASLFPHTPALAVSDRWITVGNKGDDPRITFTVPLINQSRCVMFLVSGANKQTALEAVFAETADSQQYPSRLIQPQGELWWLMDEAAGAAL